MKIITTFVVVCTLLFLLSPSLAQIFNQLPGDTDADKIANLQRAIAQFRTYLAGQSCFTRLFQTPNDVDEIDRWVGWFCSYFGGPAGSENCSFLSDNGTALTSPEDLEQSLFDSHESLNLSRAQNDLFIDLLAKAIAGTSNDANVTGLEDQIIMSLEAIPLVLPEFENQTCPEADLTLDWFVDGSDNQSNRIPVGALVTWRWEDDEMHSVDADNNPDLVGFGGGDRTLARTTRCTADSAAYPDGGIPCNLAGDGEFSYSHYFDQEMVVRYHCDVHPDQMFGVLFVGNATESQSASQSSQDSQSASQSSVSQSSQASQSQSQASQSASQASQSQALSAGQAEAFLEGDGDGDGKHSWSPASTRSSWLNLYQL